MITELVTGAWGIKEEVLLFLIYFFNVFMYGRGSNVINASNFPSLLVPIIPKELKMVSNSNLTHTFEFRGGDFLIYNEILTIPQNRNCFIGLLRSSRALANTVWRLSFY